VGFLKKLGQATGVISPAGDGGDIDGAPHESSELPAPAKRAIGRRGAAVIPPLAPPQQSAPPVRRATTTAISDVDPDLEARKDGIIEQLGSDSPSYKAFAQSRADLRSAMPGQPEEAYLKGALNLVARSGGVMPIAIVQDLVLLPMGVDRVRDEFNRQVAEYRAEHIDGPNQELEGKRKERQELEERLKTLASEIQAGEGAIAVEEAKLARQGEVFEAALTAVKGDFSRDLIAIQALYPDTASAVRMPSSGGGE
jgi:hypothetical protein